MTNCFNQPDKGKVFTVFKASGLFDMYRKARIRVYACANTPANGFDFDLQMKWWLD